MRRFKNGGKKREKEGQKSENQEGGKLHAIRQM